MIKISASIMCANFTNLGKDILRLERAGVDWLHFDIMDGHFVPNFTMGPDLMRSLRGITKLPFDVHLMVEEPGPYIETFVRAGGDILVVHAEACTHLHRLIQSIKSFGIKVGVALNPATPISAIEYVLGDLDVALIMAVNPGFAGQRFIPSVLPKIERLRDTISRMGLSIDVQVDGNVCVQTAPDLVAAGANVLVGGSSGIFTGRGSIEENVRALRAAAEGGNGPEACPPLRAGER
ncbi:MAG: ribulose-phosphate 3-epimerase [bacterium]